MAPRSSAGNDRHGSRGVYPGRLMRILSLTYEYPPIGGGGSVVASSLNETLIHFGDTVDVVTSAMPDLERETIMGGVRVHRVPCLRRHAHYTTAPELATTLLP